MRSHLHSTTSPWLDITGVVRAPLEIDEKCDVCVVGAGIAGLSVAYRLARERRRVIVIDKGAIASGETGYTTAHLSNAIDDRYYVIQHLHGRDAARLCAQSHTAAIHKIESIVKKENVDCDFERVDGYLFVPPGESRDLLDRELHAAQEAGVPHVELVSRAPWQGYDTGPCLKFGNQAQIHPLKYMAGLAGAIERLGGRIYCETELHDIREEDPIRLITTDDMEIRAWAVVIATNTPINNRVTIHTKQAGYRTYAIALRSKPGAVPRALYWDTTQEAGQSAAAPYHYVRTANWNPPESTVGRAPLPPDELVIVGGEDHKTGQAHDSDERWSRLEAWIRERFPHLGEVVLRWSGQVWEPVDGVAFIGRNPGGPENIYIATGDSGMGMTHGAIAGILLSDLIAERPNAWAKLYDPSRITLRSGFEFARENLNTAAQYLDWLAAGSVDKVEDIKRDSGAIVRRGLSPVAVYRDESGELHECSAVCPHLGGIVSWNAAERTWDCPCHGSRFAPDGTVLNGPANSPLQSTRADVPASRT